MLEPAPAAAGSLGGPKPRAEAARHLRRHAGSAGAPSERLRRKIVTLVLLLFWLLLLEGVLRKWVAPQLGKFLFFLRDPFVIVLYLLAIRAGAFRGASIVLGIGVALGLLSIGVAALQIVSNGFPKAEIVAAYGWRNYFLYLPLPFVMASCMRMADLRRFALHVIAAAAVVAPLVVLQANTPASSIINRGIAEDESLQFKSMGLMGSHIRPNGPFTSSAGMSQVAPSTLAFVIGFWLLPRRQRPVAWPWLVAGAVAAGCALAVGGSRGGFLMSALVLASAVGATFLVRQAGVRAKALLIPSALAVLATVLYPVLFPEAYQAMADRVTAAHASESKFSQWGIFARAFSETYGFVWLMGDAPLAGYGLGLGGNGRTFVAQELVGLPLAESDWTRHIVDLGPLVGVLFIVYRIAFAGWLLQEVLSATRGSANPLPLALFGYVGILLFYGQLTGHGTVNGYTWLFVGACMASCRAVLDVAPTRIATLAMGGTPPVLRLGRSAGSLR